MADDGRREHAERWAAAALRWAEVNADFAEASTALAEVVREAIAHAGNDATPESLSLLERFGDHLEERASAARQDGLDGGEIAATLRQMAAGA